MLSRIAPRFLRALLVGSAVSAVLSAGSAFAATANLSSGNSTLTYDLTGADGNSSWVVDGVDQFGGSPAGNQWFYVSIGGGSPMPLSGLSLISNLETTSTVTATYAPLIAQNAEIAADIATVPAFTISFTSILTGGAIGSGTSAISTIASINNNEGSPLSLKFYDYVNANVSGTASNDTLTASGLPVNTFDQTDPNGQDLNFTVIPNPDHTQVALDGSILTALNGGSAPTLTDNFTAPLTGDAKFAIEFDETVAANGTNQISINETLNNNGGSSVPLPKSAWSALAMLSGLGIFGLIRRSKTSAA